MSQPDQRDDPAPRRTATSAAESKRQAARRRFLLGGAGALPVIVTLGQKQALAASASVCQSAGIPYGEGFTRDDYGRSKAGRLAMSIYCRPENL